jgi:hypothetical protein
MDLQISANSVQSTLAMVTPDGKSVNAMLVGLRVVDVRHGK